jgi:hypothetical protein
MSQHKRPGREALTEPRRRALWRLRLGPRPGSYRHGKEPSIAEQARVIREIATLESRVPNHQSASGRSE